MFQERLHQAIGIKREYPTNIVAVATMIGLSRLYGRITGLRVEGHPLPAEGSWIYIYHHLDILDPFRLYCATLSATRGPDGEQALARNPRAIAKSTLFGIPELAKIKERTGKKDILNSNNRLVGALIRVIIGSLLYGNGHFPISRGTDDHAAKTEINQTLASGQGVVMSIMESRDKTGGLKGIKKGVAMVVKTHPDIPFQLLGISKEPHRVNIGNPQTYNAIKDERGNLNLRDLTLLLADGIAELLPEPIQKRWREGERQAEYQSLYPRRTQLV